MAGTPDQTRTDNKTILSRLPLPIGLQELDLTMAETRIELA